MGLRIVVAADPAAVEYKDVVKADLEADSRVDDVIDVGVQAGDDTLYPRIGIKGAHVIKDGKADRGIFFCGTGMGMAITANKVPPTTPSPWSGSSCPTTPTCYASANASSVANSPVA